MGAISSIILTENIDLFGKALNSVWLKQNECMLKNSNKKMEKET